MVTRFGMTTELGQVAYETEAATFLSGQVPSWRPRSYGDGTAKEIDHAVQRLIERAFRTARAILEQNRSTLDIGAKELMELETLGPEQLAKFNRKIKRKYTTKPVYSTYTAARAKAAPHSKARKQ
jgi:cell division protease FtsH